MDKLAEDFVEHCSTRWETGKSMLVCIDKITCARMFQRIEPRWKAKLARLQALIPGKEVALAAATDPDIRERLTAELDAVRSQAQWMESTIIELIISEAQNEPRDFAKWGFDIIPHRMVMKTGFQTPDGKRVPVDDAFKDPQHPFGKSGIVRVDPRTITTVIFGLRTSSAAEWMIRDWISWRGNEVNVRRVQFRGKSFVLEELPA